MLSLLNSLLGPARAAALESPENSRGSADESDFPSLLAALFAGVGTDTAGGEASDPGGTALPAVPAERQAAAEAADDLHRPVYPELEAAPNPAAAAEAPAGPAHPPLPAVRDAAPAPTPDSVGAAPASAKVPSNGVASAAPREGRGDASPIPRPAFDLGRPAPVERDAGENARVPAPAIEAVRPPMPDARVTSTDRDIAAAVRDRIATSAQPAESPPAAQADEPAARRAIVLTTRDSTLSAPAAARPGSFELRREGDGDAPAARAPAVPSSTADAAPARFDPASNPVATSVRAPVNPPSAAAEVRPGPPRESGGRAEQGTRDGARARADSSITVPMIERAVVTVDPARVRQAADLLRRWQAGAAGVEASRADASDGRHAATPPATSAAPGSGASASAGTAAASGADGAALSLAGGQVAAEQLVQRVLQGQARGMSSLSFRLSPAELGRLEIRMRRHGDRMEIAFTTTQAAARELIEASLPHLRALLQDVGIQLTDADVRHEGAGRDGFRGAWAGSGYGEGGERRAQREDGGRTAPAMTNESTATTGSGSEPRSPSGSGTIDAFA